MDTVSDGLAGIRLAESTRPDAVVLELKMPGMGGEEVLQRLRELCPGIQVFLFTVYGDFCHRVIHLDVHGCFVKSADLTPLIDAINAAVDA